MTSYAQPAGFESANGAVQTLVTDLDIVGDLDGDLTAKLRRAADAAHDETAAFAVVRLTFRRR